MAQELAAGKIDAAAMPEPFATAAEQQYGAVELADLNQGATHVAHPAAYAAQAGGDPVGVWLTQAGDAKVKVTKCGGGICGVIVWLKAPVDAATGKPAIDDTIQ